MAETLLDRPLPFDPTSPLVASGNLRRRQIINELVHGAARLAAVLAVAVLVLVTVDVIKNGVGAVSFDFLFKDPQAFGAGGGIASAIVGTILIVALGAAIATPLGVLCALYLVELGNPKSVASRALRLALDMMQGLPTVVVGLFVLGLIVIPEKADSGFAGSLALAMIMLPLIARTTQEVLNTIPQSLRDASDALGVEQWRAVLTVLLPTAASGILTGVILAVARAAGETAPLLIVDSAFTNSTTVELFGHAVPNIPVLIWTSFESPTPDGVRRAWGAALVLFALILIANIGARTALARNRRKMGL